MQCANSRSVVANGIRKRKWFAESRNNDDNIDWCLHLNECTSVVRRQRSQIHFNESRSEPHRKQTRSLHGDIPSIWRSLIVRTHVQPSIRMIFVSFQLLSTVVWSSGGPGRHLSSTIIAWFVLCVRPLRLHTIDNDQFNWATASSFRFAAVAPQKPLRNVDNSL